jgi:AAA domain/CHC2 zinc finger
MLHACLHVHVRAKGGAMSTFQDLFERHIQRSRVSGEQLYGLCPFHGDTEPSFSANLRRGVWKCHACDLAGNAYHFAVRLKIDPTPFANGQEDVPQEPTPEEMAKHDQDLRAYFYENEIYLKDAYDYTAPDGVTLLYQMCKFALLNGARQKWFQPRSPDPEKPDGWNYHQAIKTHVLYRQADLAEAAGVFYVEGEADVDTLCAHGWTATTHATGASLDLAKRREMFAPLTGKHVVCIPDNDEPGRTMAAKLTGVLKGLVASFSILTLPATPEHEDISWWLAHHTIEEFQALTPVVVFTADEKKTRPKARTVPTWRFTGYTAAALQTQVIPPPKEIVPGLILEGLNVLAGAPKIGKSMFALNIAVAVATGGKALSLYPVTQGRVLFFALEDNKRRMQDRMNILLGEDVPWPELLTIEHTAPRIGQGLEEALEDWLHDYPDTRLIGIDTFIKVRPPRRRHADSYQEDSDLVGRLQTFALGESIGMIVNHHTKKGPEEDFLSSISGTHGITGSADAALVLKRKRFEKDGTLHVTGRDVDERELALRFVDQDWQVLGDATDVWRSEARQAIIDALKKHAKLMPIELAALTGKNRNTIRRLLHFMREAGEVYKAENYYSLSPLFVRT